MDTPENPLPQLQVPERLIPLFKFCEQYCVAVCCGIGAFNFSPFSLAVFLSNSGHLDENAVPEWIGLVSEFEANFEALNATGPGLICEIEPLEQKFTEEAVRALFSELRASIEAVPAILEFSNRLASPVSAWKIMHNHEALAKGRPREVIP